jgi:GNAT superfamily N-acetyltransferase
VIAIASVVPDDWARWREIRLAALAEAPYAFGSTYVSWQGAAEARWRKRLTEVAYNVLAMDGDRDVGMVSGVDEDPVELISLWVAPDVLIASVLAWAAPRATQLRVYPHNQQAVALYTRHGFVPIGVDEGELAMVRR